MNAITIKGLKVEARHGVLPQEKTTPQTFLFDINIEADLSLAAKTDDLNYTVNYDEVCKAVTQFCKDNTFNLIEKLAYGAAYLIAEKYEIVSAVEVTVHKPQAPVNLPFGDISATARVERNKVVLSLGSSSGDKRATLEKAIASLDRLDGVRVLKISDFVSTEPYGGVAKNTFLNCAITAECLLSPRALLDKIHEIEAANGRVRDVRWGDRTLDIDIIFFGNKIIAEEGLCIPHSDYANRQFVIIPVKQIAPDFVCPKTLRRMADL